MTTTAYDTAAILRQNVADLELQLQQQRERHAAATARLRDQIERVTSEWERADKAVAETREDLQSFIDSRDAWMARADKAEAALKEAQEQEPVAWCDPVEFADDPWSFQGFRIRTKNYPTMPLYARPIPAPVVQEEWQKCWLIERPASSEWSAIWLTITTDGRRWVSDGGTLYATGGDWYFTSAASEALKFADKESADEYVRHNKIKDVVVTEHIFEARSL